MELIIAEKKALAELIADAIPGKAQSGNGTICKGNYCITWASGHLLGLKEPDEYNPALKKWSLADLPIYFKDWQVRPLPGSSSGKNAAERLREIKKLIDKADVIIHAGDPDDEGQLLIDEILRYYKVKKPVKRLATGDTTAPALRAALGNMDDNRLHEAAGWAAYARSVADMTFGINLSRYFSLTNPPAKLTIGRVQSPTLNLVVVREEQIQSHKKVTYYDITADIHIQELVIPCRYEPKKDDPNLVEGRILDPGYAAEKTAMLSSLDLSNIRVTRNIGEENPPLPFNLVKLQSYCGQRFGYSPSETLAYSQSLRDKYNAITYNRSSCQYLSDHHFEQAPKTMKTVITNIGGYKPKELDMTIHSRCFDSSKIEAHFAIIPQDVCVDTSKMTVQEKNVYLAVCKYYMVQFMPPAVKERTRLEVLLPDGGMLVSSSMVVQKPGYLKLFASDRQQNASEWFQKEQRSPLSDLSPGVYSGIVKNAKTEEKETRPPSRYTQVTLNEDMTRISKYVEDPEVKRLLLAKDKDKKSENGSIGTDATRADIIKNLIVRGFIEEKGEGKKKYLYPTDLGKELIRIIPDEAKKPDITAYWWSMQEDIRQGNASYESLTDHVLQMVAQILQEPHPRMDGKFLPARNSRREVVGKCPRCGNNVVEGKKGFGCTGYKNGCKFVIWKKPASPVFAHVTFTAANAKAFLSGRPVHKKNLISKAGKSFEADLVMEDNPNSPYGPDFRFQFADKKGKSAEKNRGKGSFAK